MTTSTTNPFDFKIALTHILSNQTTSEKDIQFIRKRLSLFKEEQCDSFNKYLKSDNSKSFIIKFLNYIKHAIAETQRHGLSATLNIMNALKDLLMLEYQEGESMLHILIKHHTYTQKDIVRILNEFSRKSPDALQSLLTHNSHLHTNALDFSAIFYEDNENQAIMKMFEKCLNNMTKEEAFTLFSHKNRWLGSSTWHLLAFNNVTGRYGMKMFQKLIANFIELGVEKEVLLQTITYFDKIEWEKGPSQYIHFKEQLIKSNGWNILDLVARYQNPEVLQSYFDFVKH